MNQRQVIILWAIALVLVAAVVIANVSKSDVYESATRLERGDPLLADFDPVAVRRIEIRQGDEKTLLVKGEETWTVDNRDDYPANVRDINDLLRLVDEVEVTQGIEADPSFAPRFGMDPDAGDEAEQGTTVVFSDGEGSELATLTLGKNLEAASNPMNPFGGGSTGRFVRNHADDSGIYVTSELFPSLRAAPSEWLAEDFLKVQKIESVAVSEPGAPDTLAWKLTREDEQGDFTLEGKQETEALNSSAINPLKNLFSYARFEDVVPAREAADAWKADEKRQAVIETFEGITYTIEFGPKATDGSDGTSEPYLMTVAVEAEIAAERRKGEDETEDEAKKLDEAFAERKTELEKNLAAAQALEGRLFQVTKFTVDALLKDRDGLLQKPAEPAASTNNAPGVPPGIAAPPRQPARAVTPPIAIPPAPAQEEGGE